MSLKKNDLCTITIHGYTAEGMGVGRTDEGMAVFVPGAARGDKLEVLLVRAPADLMEISDCLRAVQSQKYECDMITFRSASRIRVYADPVMPWTLDGEREEGHACVDVENIHRAVRIIQRRKK